MMKKTRATLAALLCTSALMLGACSNDNDGDTKAQETTTVKYDSADDKSLVRDMNGQEVDRSDAANANVSPEDMNQISDAGESFIIDSVGLNVPLGTLTSYNGVIEPVNYTSAFVVADYSPGYVNSEDGSVIVVAHALDGAGKAPGNYVVDPNTGAPLANIGDRIVVGSKTYEITDQRSILKDEIPNSDLVWAEEPGVMHFITCVPHRNENLVITAKEVVE
ncbi:hypothetical protein EML15_05205 [Corynebacterium sp. sy017]|uniref:hypothetical protein n=1 Tax=unclassified Corynebacterium TaxID=2624378 RepID=UPI00118486B0|nr:MULTISPECIES: hypothetical protein [unclassified Corynebacterium]MBP3088543.1 hypothetical protein [Corynebacterium sp. sy017]TSD91844.1 hypothetical protein ELY17_05205 [Corynebacterium sp. SY003]